MHSVSLHELIIVCLILHCQAFTLFFQMLAIINNTLNSVGDIPGNGIPESKHISILVIYRSCQIALQLALQIYIPITVYRRFLFPYAFINLDIINNLSFVRLAKKIFFGWFITCISLITDLSEWFNTFLYAYWSCVFLQLNYTLILFYFFLLDCFIS